MHQKWFQEVDIVSVGSSQAVSVGGNVLLTTGRFDVDRDRLGAGSLRADERLGNLGNDRNC